MTSNGLYSSEPRARLCHLRRWPNFIGYGFNLHCEKIKPGQYIGKVDPDSPAESAGLRENDRIVEVNFVPIGNENHKQVVTRIKEGVSRNNSKYTEEVILLVLDPQADDYYKSKSIIPRSTDPNVEKLETENRDVTGERARESNQQQSIVDGLAYLLLEHSDSSPQLSNRSIGKADSPISRELSPQTKLPDANRDYKRVTDFTGPSVLRTKVRNSPFSSSSMNKSSFGHRFLGARSLSLISFIRNQRRELSREIKCQFWLGLRAREAMSVALPVTRQIYL